MITLISKITADHVGQPIPIAGWIQNIRSSGKLCFIELRDGSSYMQCVSEINTLGETTFKELESLGIESSLALT